jgi:ABC-type multidrug transport system ATPase subunit
VTVGEMLIDPNASIFCLDNITDGLASTDSFSLIQQISAACKKYRLAAVITLLQPSNEIVQLFDKLLVLLSENNVLYFCSVCSLFSSSLFVLIMFVLLYQLYI